MLYKINRHVYLTLVGKQLCLALSLNVMPESVLALYNPVSSPVSTGVAPRTQNEIQPPQFPVLPMRACMQVKNLFSFLEGYFRTPLEDRYFSFFHPFLNDLFSL